MHTRWVYGNPHTKVRFTNFALFFYPLLFFLQNTLLDLFFNADFESESRFLIWLILFEFSHFLLFANFHPFFTPFLSLSYKKTGATYNFTNDKVLLYFSTLYNMLQTAFHYLLYFSRYKLSRPNFHCSTPKSKFEILRISMPDSNSLN